MHDWMFETGGDPLPLTLPTPSPGTPDDAASWFEPVSDKSELDDFGPMFTGYDGGASIIDDVIVTGTRNSGGGDYDNSWYDWDGYDTSVPDLPQEPPRPEFQGEDCATSSITAEINSRATNNTAEHSAAVYRGDDGLYRTTPVFDGAGGIAPVAELMMWLINNGVPFSQLTSLYHNHDDASTPDDAANVAVNRYPSHLYAGNGTGDWVVADLFVNPDPRLGQAAGADPDVFKLTIEDTAGVARDFAYADKEKYKALTKEEMMAEKDLPGAETGC